MKTQMSKMSSKRSQLTLTHDVLLLCTDIGHACVQMGKLATSVAGSRRWPAKSRRFVHTYATWVLGSLKSTFVY